MLLLKLLLLGCHGTHQTGCCGSDHLVGGVQHDVMLRIGGAIAYNHSAIRIAIIIACTVHKAHIFLINDTAAIGRTVQFYRRLLLQVILLLPRLKRCAISDVVKTSSLDILIVERGDLVRVVVRGSVATTVGDEVRLAELQSHGQSPLFGGLKTHGRSRP